MPRALTELEIDLLAHSKGVRTIAVENFLGSLPLDIPKSGQMLNLANDARSYGWNEATVAAIAAGIGLAYRGRP